jgi:hypothetical protein
MESLGKPCDELEEGEIGEEEPLPDIRREASFESEQTLYWRSPKSECESAFPPWPLLCLFLSLGSGYIMSVELVEGGYTAKKLQDSQDGMA